MRRLLLTAVGVAALSTPALARDGQPYIGVEGGAVFADKTKFDLTIDDGRTVTEYDNGASLKYKKPGWEVDALAGYDFGVIRAEAEIGYKRLKAKSVNFSPALATDVGLPDTGPYNPDDFFIDRKASVLSGMVNVLFDLGDENGFSYYAGGGLGRARVKMFDDKDNAWAWQLIAGVRYAITQNVDVGLKYRYFNTGKLDFRDDFDTGGQLGIVGLDGQGKLHTHSVLATLTYNFGAPAAAPPPPPPPPPPAPPPPPPPATQTCPDGMVIRADQACPPPPPPPPPAPERG